MLLAGFIIGILNGRIEEVTNAAFASAGRAVELSIGLLGTTCLWTGLVKIMERSGLIHVIARLARPVLAFIFRDIRDNDEAIGAIVMNLTANFLGLGNAATPLGIKAMVELQKINRRKDTASNAMCMFLVLNATAIQLIPATVIALRHDAGSDAPSEIMVCVWIASIAATFAGILMVRVLSEAEKRKMDVKARCMRAGGLHIKSMQSRRRMTGKCLD